MVRTVIVMFVALSLVLTSGCIPYWIHMDVANRCEEYRKVIDGYEKRHQADVDEVTKADAERDRYKSENQRLNEIAQANEKTIKGFEDMVNEFKAGLAENLKQAGVIEEEGVKITQEGTISIEAEVLFDSGSADLKKKAKEILAKLAPALKKYEDYNLRIDGHTDDQPIRVTADKFKSNFHLGAMRALSVLDELARHGIPEKKMYIASYGEYRPAPGVPNAPGKKGAKGNRRVEIAVVKTAR
jgi:flagellar motor protein MotB